MKTSTLNRILRTARAVNSWRIFPRMMISVYLILLVWSVAWYIGLEAPTDAQSTFIVTLVGAGACWFSTYVMTGSVHDDEKE